MNIKTLLLLTLSSALLPLASQAKPEDALGKGKGEPPAPAQVIERLDTDGNGSISKDEAKGPMAKNFDRIDANSDGEITMTELAIARENRKEKAGQLKNADRDGNGAISADEAAEAGLDRLVQHFDKIDADGDGEISKQEMGQMAKQRKNKERVGKQGEE